MTKLITKPLKLSGLSFAINDFYLNYFIQVYKTFEGDIEMAIVYSAVAYYNASHALRKGCNAHSISLSSGIPSETVRRKIKKLIDIGYIDIAEKRQLFASELSKIQQKKHFVEIQKNFLDLAIKINVDKLI